MTDYERLYRGIGRAAWGYFFIYFDFNINKFSLIPSFVGYALFLLAIDLLLDEERELGLLKSLAIILIVWHGANWISGQLLTEIGGIIHIAEIVMGVVNLYFHFQLLTNLASIATKYQPEGYSSDTKLLRCRTLQTLMLSAIIILEYLSGWVKETGSILSLALSIVYIIAGIVLMFTLFRLRKVIMPDEEDNEPANSEE